MVSNGIPRELVLVAFSVSVQLSWLWVTRIVCSRKTVENVEEILKELGLFRKGKMKEREIFKYAHSYTTGDLN